MLTLIRIFLCCLSFTLFGCGLVEEPGKRGSAARLIVTPVSAYTTEKGRRLGEKYQENLDRIVEQIVQNPVTGRLQFANNIVAVGGIGFFTHSASKSPDERYLEVILGVPDVLDQKTDFNSKVDLIFSRYGLDLLAIVSSDREIYEDGDVSGYGLNFSWRISSKAASGPRVTLESAVIYIPKESAQGFLTRQISQEALLGTSVVFAIQGQGPARIARHFPQPPKPTAQPQTAKRETEIPRAEPKPPVMPLPPQEESSERKVEAEVKPPEKVPPLSTKPQPKSPVMPLPPQEGSSERKAEAKVKPPEKVPPLLTKPQPKSPVMPLLPQEGSSERKAEAKVKPPEKVPPLLTKPQPKREGIKGYIVQLTIPDKAEAERLSEALSRQGYSTSSVEREDRSVRLRVGNFPSHAGAKKFLDQLQQQGVTGGLVLQAPR